MNVKDIKEILDKSKLNDSKVRMRLQFKILELFKKEGLNPIECSYFCKFLAHSIPTAAQEAYNQALKNSAPMN